MIVDTKKAVPIALLNERCLPRRADKIHAKGYRLSLILSIKNAQHYNVDNDRCPPE